MNTWKVKAAACAVVFLFCFQGPPVGLAGSAEEVPVLLYHSILENPGNPYAISPETFGEQLSFLKENGYNSVLTVSFCAFMEGGELPGKPVMITFDDGWKNFYRNARPILKKYGFKAVVFVFPSAAAAGESGYMTLHELKEIEKEGFDIQSHTLSHLYLTRRNDESDTEYDRDVLQEFIFSRIWLESNLGKKIQCIAYPYGYYSSWIGTLAEISKYRLAFTVNPGPNTKKDPPFMYRRYMVLRKHSLAEFTEMLVTGALRVSKIFPENGGSPESPGVPVYAVLKDPGDIDTSTLRFTINSRTEETRFDSLTGTVSASVDYNFNKGFHAVVLSARDRDNRPVETSWAFVVR